MIRIAEADEWKTGFRTYQGSFKYTVMPLGLTNAAASFQEMMDTIIKGIEGCTWYLDDILIFGGDIQEEQQAFIEKILAKWV